MDITITYLSKNINQGLISNSIAFAIVPSCAEQLHVTAPCRTLGDGGYEEDVQSSESSSSASTQDGTFGGLKSLFQVCVPKRESITRAIQLRCKVLSI